MKIKPTYRRCQNGDFCVVNNMQGKYIPCFSVSSLWGYLKNPANLGPVASLEIPVLGFPKLGFKDLHKMVREGGWRSWLGTNWLEWSWSLWPRCAAVYSVYRLISISFLLFNKVNKLAKWNLENTGFNLTITCTW